MHLKVYYGDDSSFIQLVSMVGQISDYQDSYEEWSFMCSAAAVVLFLDLAVFSLR